MSEVPGNPFLVHCPACEHQIGVARGLDDMQDLMEIHIEHCLPSVRVANALRDGTLSQLNAEVTE